MLDRPIPVQTNGNARSAAKMLRGTENEVWIKYLKVHHANRAMTPQEWMSIIERAKRQPAKAYS